MPLIVSRAIIPEDQRVIEILRNTALGCKKVIYQKYLSTFYWDEVRRKMLCLSGCRCERCGANNEVLSVHHRTYDRIGKEEESDLIVLCWPCHKEFHDESRKNTL